MVAKLLNNIRPGGVHKKIMFCVQPHLVVRFFCFDISSDKSPKVVALFVIVFI